MAPYVFIYYQWTKDSPYSIKLVSLFFCGLFFHFFRKIEPGTEAELIFFGKATGKFWEDGFCLVPSLLPILHTIGIYLLWDLKKPIDPHVHKSSPGRTINVEHFHDQRLPMYQVKTKTSLLGMQASRLTGNIFGWFFSVDRKNSELMFQKIGFRIVLVALAAGWIAVPSPTHNEVPTIPAPQPPSITEPRDEPTPNQPIQDDSTVTVKVQLGEPPFPAFPSKEHFEVEESTTIQLYYLYKGIEYNRYHRGIGDRPPVVVAEKSSCVIVPAGKSVFIKTVSPPILAINMVNEVSFVVDKAKLPSRNIFATIFLPAPSLVFYKDWRYLQKNWGIVDIVGGYMLLAKASTEGEIPPPYHGGLVCF